MADISNITVSAEGVDTVCKIKDKVARNDIAINRTTLGTQCKNLLKHTAVTTTINGITFTVNADGTITASGTATANAVFKFATLTLKQGTYKYSGISITPSTSTANMSVFRTSDWVGLCALAEKDTFTITADTKIECRAVIYNGYTANNVVFYPMLRYADITDSTYEPYKESVDERLTENTSDIAVSKSTLGYQCKNLLKPTNSITRAGITYTVNSDGSVTLTGTSTSGSSYNYFSIPITLQAGKYKVSGMPETSKTNTYRVDLRANASGGTAYGYGAKEFEVEFTETTTAYYMIRIDGSYKESLNGVTFYPMVRYADITDDTYEPYQPSVQEQIDNFGTQQQLLCDYSSAATSSVTIQIAGLFSNYSAVICTVKYYLGTTSITLPLKYIKSIGKSKEYSPVSELGFRYVDDNNLFIGGADAAISNVKIISLY